MTDSQLLEQFVIEQDHAAFRALVDRHGPEVLRTCQYLLRDPHDAQDAFQATFLVLIRRAPSIEDPERLRGWLVGVAHRIARRARLRAARQRQREQGGMETRIEDRPAGRQPPNEVSGNELGVLLREELDRLAEKYRAPLILCYLQGLTHEQAAKRLGWPVGTVKVRLVRGRRQLRDRLDRRGLGAALLLLLLWPRRAPAALPDQLAVSTVEAMELAAAGEHAALARRFDRAAAWAEAALHARTRGPHRFWALLALLALTATATGCAFLAEQAASHDEIGSLPPSLTNVLNVRCR